MPRGKTNIQKNICKNKTASVEQHQDAQTMQHSEYQDNQTQQHSKHQGYQTPQELLLGQRNIDAQSVPRGFDNSTSLARSTGDNLLLPGHFKVSDRNEVPYKNDSSREHCNQGHRKRHLSNDETINHLQPKCTRADDTILLNSIEAASQDQALELLKINHTFSQNGLDRALLLACGHGHKYLAQTLVCLGANVHLKDTKGNTSLLICAENCFIDIVRFLLSKKADVNAVNFAGNTALIISIRSSGSVEMVKVLLEHRGININHQNHDGYTALMKAVEVRDIDTMKMLLKELCNQSSRDWSRDPYFQQTSHDQSVDTIQRAKTIAEKCGLGNVFRFLSESIHIGESPLVIAIEESDKESFNILLNCQFLDASDMERSVEQGFIKLFKKCGMKDVKTFNDNDIAMIERCLECGANVSTCICSCSPISIAVEAGNYRLVESLCKHGALLRQVWYGRESGPLQMAAKIGRSDLIELLLKYEGNINQKDFCGSALDCALCHGHIECAKRLIQLGATLDIKHALISAVDHQLPEYMSFLFDNYEQEILNHFHEDTESQSILLVSAVKKGNLKIIGQILDTGADINRPTNNGVTPLVKSKNGEAAHFLIQRGADVTQMIDSKRSGRITPVIHILKTRYDYDSPTLELVKVLLEKGASINWKDTTNKTALMMAAEKEGSMDMLQILLDHGADPSDKDDDCNTALIIALIGRCFQNASFLLQSIKNKEIINAQNHEGSSALICAVTCGKLNIVTDLLKLGVDVNAIDAKGNTAVMYTLIESISQKNDILKILINAGSDINYQNNEGLSPLMMTANKSMKDAMQILLDSGADVNAVSKTNDTRTALSCLFDGSFLIEGTKCCMEYLLEGGASASYVSPLSLVQIILHSCTEVIPKMIQRGLGPANIKSNEIPLRVIDPSLIFSVSPLCMALLVGNVDLAIYFFGNLFLTHSDVSSLARNKDLRRILVKNNYLDCLNFLDKMSLQVFSLFKLSFVAVTSAVGSSPGRENRVSLLPLPQMMKDKLLFKTEEVSLTVPSLNNIKTHTLLVMNRFINDVYDIDAASYVDSDDDSSNGIVWYYDDSDTD